MTKLLLYIIIIPLVFLPVSCDMFPGIQTPSDDLGTLDANSFYAQNMATQQYYKVTAEQLYEGEQCLIWAEAGSDVTENMAQAIAKEYDQKIRSKMIDTFSMKNFGIKNVAGTFDDMLDYANWLAGKSNKKLTILLLDIKDNYKGQDTDMYVAGYFFSGNFWTKGKIDSTHYSNSTDMIYLDTYPGLNQTKLEQTYVTLAHELQHLIHYVTMEHINKTTYTDTWIDEGLSSQAEYLYLEKNPADKYEWFSVDQQGTIERGNNFYVWGNHAEDSLAILDDYATVYLFFRWLYLQAAGTSQPGILYEIITSQDADYHAVTTAAANINPDWGEWENLLGDWFAANYNPQSALGYTGDPELLEFIKIRPTYGEQIWLFPGEGVYSITRNSSVPNASRNIRYAMLTSANTGRPQNSSMLLTFNANPINTGAAETGRLSGVYPAGRVVTGGVSRGQFTGPYVLGARDMLERNRAAGRDE